MRTSTASRWISRSARAVARPIPWTPTCCIFPTKAAFLRTRISSRKTLGGAEPCRPERRPAGNESITLERGVHGLKDDRMPRYARMIYNGYWFSQERVVLQSLIDSSQQTVNGTVRLKLYKGTVLGVGRASRSDSLFDSRIATFDDDKGAYNQADAAGFIRLNALRLRIGAKHRRK